MHRMMDKIKLTQIGGQVQLFGRVVEFEFVEKDVSCNDTAELVIRGLTLEQATQLLQLGHVAGVVGAVLQDEESVLAATLEASALSKATLADLDAHAQQPVPGAWEAVTSAADPEPEPAPKAARKTRSSTAPPPVTREPESPTPEADAYKFSDEDLGEHGVTLDLAKMNTFTKLRELIEYSMACGHTDPKSIYDVLAPLRDAVPVLTALAGKGGFERKLERAIDTVLVGKQV